MLIPIISESLSDTVTAIAVKHADINVNLECNDAFSLVVRDYRAMIHIVLSCAYVKLGCGIRENLLRLPQSPL